MLANIALSGYGVAVITEQGVLPLLARLTTTKVDDVRQHLCWALTEVCKYKDNRRLFNAEREDGVEPLRNLVVFMRSQDLMVLRATAMHFEQRPQKSRPT